MLVSSLMAGYADKLSVGCKAEGYGDGSLILALRSPCSIMSFSSVDETAPLIDPIPMLPVPNTLLVC